MMKRIVSVWLNNFPLDRLKREEQEKCVPHLRTRDPGNASNASREAAPFGLVVKETRGIQISALNDAARQGGIHEGMRLNDARALQPTLLTRPADPEKDAAVLRALAKWCQRYTPVTSVDGTDSLWLDITGAAHLFGGESALLRDLAGRLNEIGFQNRLALAQTPGAAWAVARYCAANTPKARNIAPHRLAEALAPLPLAALRLEESVLYLLKRFGFKTIGELCALPRVSLKRRFPSADVCEAVLQRLDQALGNANEPITPLTPVPAFYEHLSCPEPILETESFRIALHDLLSRLITRMDKNRKGATTLTFSAYHADGGVSRVSIATARPSRDADHLAHLFHEPITTINPGFGVDGLALSADAVAALGAEQLALSSRPSGKPGNGGTDQLIDRLSNRLGAHNVQRIVPRASHMPERAEKRVRALQAQPSERQLPPAKPPRPLRLLDRPEPVSVMAEVPEGPPMRFTWRRVMHQVVHAEGPERIAPEWWLNTNDGKADKRTRDYYRVEDAEGRRFWLFRDGLYSDSENGHRRPTWHMHGLFT